MTIADAVTSNPWAEAITICVTAVCGLGAYIAYRKTK